ncbi:hypothetical protein BJV78DRAFT_1287596 [Lactifluus subvellereus]|nr:hypothetical protein BJV78DRAFT_1287596 [Lactifluus subvellereus]
MPRLLVPVRVAVPSGRVQQRKEDMMSTSKAKVRLEDVACWCVRRVVFGHGGVRSAESIDVDPPSPPLAPSTSKGKQKETEPLEEFLNTGLQDIATLQGSHPLTQETTATPQLLRLAQQAAQPTPPPPILQQPIPPPPPPQQTSMATISMPQGNSNNSMKGNAPAIFDGDRSKSAKFLKEFKLYRILNGKSDNITIPYNRVALAIGYIRGPKVDNWTDTQTTLLEDRTTRAVNRIQKTDEALWASFVQDFTNAFTDTAKEQNTFNKLVNLRMQENDVDGFITTFNHLVLAAG